MADLTSEDLRAALAPILDRLDALQPHIAGLPTLGAAIEILKRDVRGLRDDMRGTSAMVQRVDGTLTDLLTELNAIHRWMAGVNDRIRKLESTD